MIRHVCSGCHYTYFEEDGDPNVGIAPGTPFDDLPEDWVCPECGLPKSDFRAFDDGSKKTGS